MIDTRGAGRDMLIALSLVALVGAGCDGCRAEPEPEPMPPVVAMPAPQPGPEPSRIDRLLDAGTDRATDEIRNREAPER